MRLRASNPRIKPAPQNYVVVALGSNLGDGKATLTSAMTRLAEFTDAPMLKSSFWETVPVDCPPGSPMFVNAVTAFVPRLAETPESLLKKLQKLEREFGRKPKTQVNEARVLDLDIIVFQTELRKETKLSVPHLRVRERAFVLAPLAEILPSLILPGQSAQVSELWRRLPDESRKGVRKL